MVNHDPLARVLHCSAHAAPAGRQNLQFQCIDSALVGNMPDPDKQWGTLKNVLTSFGIRGSARRQPESVEQPSRAVPAVDVRFE